MKNDSHFDTATNTNTVTDLVNVEHVGYRVQTV